LTPENALKLSIFIVLEKSHTKDVLVTKIYGKSTSYNSSRWNRDVLTDFNKNIFTIRTGLKANTALGADARGKVVQINFAGLYDHFLKKLIERKLLDSKFNDVLRKDFTNTLARHISYFHYEDLKRVFLNEKWHLPSIEGILNLSLFYTLDEFYTKNEKKVRKYLASIYSEDKTYQKWTRFLLKELKILSASALKDHFNVGRIKHTENTLKSALRNRLNNFRYEDLLLLLDYFGKGIFRFLILNDLPIIDDKNLSINQQILINLQNLKIAKMNNYTFAGFYTHAEDIEDIEQGLRFIKRAKNIFL